MYSCVLTVVIKGICHVVNRGCGSNLKVGGHGERGARAYMAVWGVTALYVTPT